MGRYTTVQAYADNNANMRSVPYDQAVGGGGGGSGSGESKKSGGVRPEKVDNPYGSTAGAGSGEFHVYRHARSREMARLKGLDEAEAEEKADAKFTDKVEGWKAEEERALEKRRKKRKRGKEARERKKNLKLGGVLGEGSGGAAATGGAAAVGVAASASGRAGGDAVDEGDEFEYKPMHQPAEQDDGDGKIAAKPAAVDDADAGGDKSPANPAGDTTSAPTAAPFVNDGSFLEMMKRKLAEEEADTFSAGAAAK